ncbi:M23 family metallopeptidase [Nocardia huaxiensis]|uniref:M23 family metallopeptidase n=1 Tax=Nocardia huaxiensis TaxID=2755382 RepID=A0A7D6V7K2_9NOCA|nr:M23 family metallopeptidase [Nocardia huaxiensis]QLY28271.1 M23 family metallopeptidase [Nocardia huaxiensis]UFS98292.1 M23 family metallopeptidase [Nocardia huaxiensis]
MPLHRPTSGSLSVHELLGDAESEPRSYSHRAKSAVAPRVRAVAGTAVATGALLAATAQLTPAVAYAAPLPSDGQDSSAETDVEPVTEVVEEAAPVVDSPAPVAAPFGLAGLPAEIAGPLAQAEQALKNLQETLAPVVQPAAPAPVAPPVVMPVGGEISSEFGARWGSFHYGVDIADALGTPIRSAFSGTVIDAGPASGFGQWVRVQQDDGTIAVYGHVNDFYVAPGQYVQAGEVIATVGNRGWSTGPHLHLEIWNPAGQKVDPMAWLASRGVLLEQHWGADV